MITSYNGWPASTDKAAIDIVPLSIMLDGVTYDFPGGCKGGDVHTIFTHFLPRYHRFVESLGLGHGDEWGYSYRKNRNADNLSCHSSGTAVDVNASEHPNGQRRTLHPAQVKNLREILAFYEGVLKWGGDFTGTPDEMHYEIHGSEADVHRIALKITHPSPPSSVPTLLEDPMFLFSYNGKHYLSNFFQTFNVSPALEALAVKSGAKWETLPENDMAALVGK